MKKEIWKDIEGYYGLYQISNLGRCKRLEGKGCSQERLLKPNNGRFELCKDSKGAKYAIDFLVANHFIGKSKGYVGKLIHLDGNKENNCADNLAWQGNTKSEATSQTNGTSTNGTSTNGTSTATATATTDNAGMRDGLHNMLLEAVTKEVANIDLLEINDDIPMKNKTITITDLCEKAFKYITVNPVSANKWLMKNGIIYNNDDNVKAPTVPYEKYYAEKTFKKDDYNKTEYHYFAINSKGLPFIIETITKGIDEGEIKVKIRQNKVKVKIVVDD